MFLSNRQTIGADCDPDRHRYDSAAMSKRSAGILPYRQHDGVWQVLLVHPGGPFWARKDDGAWSIAKGEYDAPEPALQAALREFREETGFELPGPFRALAPVRLKSGKVVEAWATAAELDATAFRSNRFEIEYPPGSGRMRSFPEVDRVEWFDFATAQRKINAAQVALLRELRVWLAA
jgi:predicted NUDIX family NTP pyrophosphohydrolase